MNPWNNVWSPLEVFCPVKYRTLWVYLNYNILINQYLIYNTVGAEKFALLFLTLKCHSLNMDECW